MVLVERAEGGDGEEMGVGGGIEDEERGKRWMLVAGNSNREIRKGTMVGIRRPVWEVEVKGVVWGVGVDWGILDG